MMRSLSLACVMLLAAGLAACNGCRSGAHADSAPALARASAAPTLRIYAVSNLAGALEPCGCTKNQLGGLDHFAALVAEGRRQAKGTLVVAAGPTLFQEPKLQDARRAQDQWKAEAISAGLGQLGLAGWTPGYNDWAAGASALTSLGAPAKGPLLAANLAGAQKTVMHEVAGLKVGILGVSAPAMDNIPLDGVAATDPAQAMKQAASELKANGANVIIGLAAVPRGQALRLAEMVPDLSVLVVGKPSEAGDANDAPTPPVLVGSTLVVQSSNHLQTACVVDLFVEGNDYRFQDATGVANAEAVLSLDKRMHDLEVRLQRWELEPTVQKEDVAARRADLEKLRAEKARLVESPPPPKGSFFRYSLFEVRQSQGSDADVMQRMAAYYRRVNDHNKTEFAGRKPPPVPRGGSGYTGIEVCASCHEEEKKVWDRTRHAHAYETLATQFKEYNLDCVSCHVTGYERPGGSTVTANESLRDVQCEQCHGPGQAHAKAPHQKGLIVREPTSDTCVATCHHPPHVEGFDPVKAKELIVGPGHGMPDDAPWPAWAADAGR